MCSIYHLEFYHEPLCVLLRGRHGEWQREYWNKLFADKSFIPTMSRENKCASSLSNSQSTFGLSFVFGGNVKIELELNRTPPSSHLSTTFIFLPFTPQQNTFCSRARPVVYDISDSLNHLQWLHLLNDLKPGTGKLRPNYIMYLGRKVGQGWIRL